jgi:hypothetical protein
MAQAARRDQHLLAAFAVGVCARLRTFMHQATRIGRRRLKPKSKNANR